MFCKKAARQHTPERNLRVAAVRLNDKTFGKNKKEVYWGMLYLWIFLLILGLALLVKGADWFVGGSSGIAEKCKIPPLVIGLTVVAFGTSAPELAVSVTSAIQHSTDIAVGNVVGSNIANIFLILGVSALIKKLPVQKESLKIDLPVLLGASALLIGLGVWGNSIQWWDGLILLLVFALYMTLTLLKAKKEIRAEKLKIAEAKANGTYIEEEKAPQKQPKTKVGVWFLRMQEKLWFCIILAIVGLAMVVGGGTLFVDGAKYIARAAGVSERIIALTVVAIGTSLPELVTSVMAAIKGETDIAVGNIIGSNIFNILLILGASSLFYPLAFSIQANLVDALVAFGGALLLFVFSFFDKRRLGIPAGIVFLLSFIGYYVYLFLI